ncbi:hypothetical protein Tco_0970186 [Tanacetum coccineum]
MLSAIMSQLFNRGSTTRDIEKIFSWKFLLLAQGKIPEFDSSKPNTAKFLHLKCREDNVRRQTQDGHLKMLEGYLEFFMAPEVAV